jgi:4-hydroxy-3-methylbut-2-en-1-yl diphosphate reductase
MTSAAEPAARHDSRLLVLAPLRVEARAVTVADPGSRVVRTGAGLRRAASTARVVHGRDRPAAVAVAGVAGALIDGLAPGALVVADRVLDEKGRQVPAPLASAPLVAAALRRRGLDVTLGPILSTPSLVKGSPQRARLAGTGAVAVDMETAALMEVPWDQPVAVVRAISDTSTRELLSPAIIRGGWRALRSLRAAAPALEEWAAAIGPKKVLMAGPRSFCAGVERAIETVERVLDRYGTPIYVRRQIVHNRHVVTRLEERGAVFVHELNEVPDGATVVFSAHGVAPAVRSEAAARGLRVIDATCPLVAKVHHEVQRFHARGYQVVLIGHSGHDETEGTLGEVQGVTLVEDSDDIAALEVADGERLAYVTQTTLSPDDVAGLVGGLSERFPAIVGPHAADVCYATQNRQDAVRAMAGECDVLLVIGSSNSSNTARLAEVAARAGCRAELLEDETELDLGWLRGASTVGVTAGASAPPALVERVVGALATLGPIETEERAVRNEQVNFPLPVEVR